MYLLNNLRISKIQRENSNFKIVNFDDSCLQHTSYYFRFGEIVSKNGDVKLTESESSDKLIIKPNQYVVVQSLELFKLGDTKFAILGSNSSIVEKGIIMNYSPFIDPLFNSYLTVGLKNLTDDDVVISKGDIIGKISFFDVSDTFPIEMRKGSIQENKFKNMAAYDDGPLYEENID